MDYSSATTPLRDALAFVTGRDDENNEPSSNPWIWFWQAMAGDFNEDRSGAQLGMDAAISMIPLVDQICDIRDLIANCRKLHHNVSDTWAWVSLVLTLIGLFPVLGSLLKGILKMFFVWVRRCGGDAGVKAMEPAMTWIITFLRRRDVQVYLRRHQIDEVFGWLANEVRALKARVNVAALLAAFDDAIRVLEGLVNKVSLIPATGKKAVEILEMVKKIRLRADEQFEKILAKPLGWLDAFAKRLDNEALLKRYGRLDAHNIHFRGDLPEAAAVTLMRKGPPLPPWLDQGKPSRWTKADFKEHESIVKEAADEGYPKLTQSNVESFHRLRTDDIKGPARLYRVLSPSSKGMSDCWVTEAVFHKLQSEADPRSAWRRYLAVWPHWNVNGQFVVYDIKRSETLLVWRGEASAQELDGVLANRYLEGGWEQIIFKIPDADIRHDVVRQYQRLGPGKTRLGNPIDYLTFKAISLYTTQPCPSRIDCNA
ncbi:MAG: hypothetical protein V4754_20075, partial [Pseudomonadota bacterium]